MEAKARYLASVEERETVGCFLDFRDMRESPMNRQLPVTDLRESGQAAQSESLNALI